MDSSAYTMAMWPHNHHGLLWVYLCALVFTIWSESTFPSSQRPITTWCARAAQHILSVGLPGLNGWPLGRAKSAAV